MRKIIFLLVVFCVVFMTLQATYTDAISTTGISSTYKRLMFVQFDSLITTIKPIWMGNETVSPLSISTTTLMLNDANELHFRDSATHIYSPSTNKLSIISASDMTITVPAADKFYLGTASNYITSNSLTLGANLICVDITGTGTATAPTVVCTTATISGTSTIGETLRVDGILTADGGVIGDIGSAGSRSDGYFSKLTADDEVTFTKAAGTGLAVTANQTIGGTLEVTETSILTGEVTATGGITGDVTGDVTGNITGTTFTDQSTAGIEIDGVTCINGDIRLDNSHYIAFDSDYNSRIWSDTDDEIDVNIGGTAGANTDFTFSANTLTAISGSTIKSNTISETTSETGVTLDGCLMEGKTGFYNFFAPTGSYVAFTGTDVAEGATLTSHGLTDADDVYIGGLLEVDGKTWLDGAVTVAGATTLATLEFSGDNPEINPSAQAPGDGKNFIIHGGDGSSNGGDLFLDGGAATTDGDLILGDRDGNVSINSPLLFPEYATLTCDGDEVSADITEVINYINATKADTINVADGVEGQVLSFVTIINATTFDITIIPATQGFTQTLVLNDTDECCEIIFHLNKWYIKSLNN